MGTALAIKVMGAAVVAGLLNCQLATACVVPSAPDYAFVDADVVVRATVRSYQVTRYLENPQWRDDRMERRRAIMARFEFEVVETIAGRPMRLTWSAYYKNGFLKEKWDGPYSLIVGLRARLDEDGTARIFAMSQPCSHSLLQDTAENVEAVRSAREGLPSPRQRIFRHEP